MKNFYNIYNVNEPSYIENNNYYKHKRETVLATIKPICDAFEITDYDYICNGSQERLITVVKNALLLRGRKSAVLVILSEQPSVS